MVARSILRWVVLALCLAAPFAASPTPQGPVALAEDSKPNTGG